MHNVASPSGVVAFVCIVSDMGLGPNGTVNEIGKERKAHPKVDDHASGLGGANRHADSDTQ